MKYTREIDTVPLQVAEQFFVIFCNGSADGLNRFVAGDAALAGLHLPEENGWNVASISELGLKDAVLISWASRKRGLLVSREAAPTVRSVADLKGRRVAMRQPGTGTALLFSRLLADAGLSEADLTTGPATAHTENDAASAVAAGEADAALGIETAARPFKLAFVPLAEEWGLALPLTELVMHQAFELRQQLRQSDIHHCRLAINIPGFLLRDKKLIEGIIARLRMGSLYGSQLALEITEHSYVHADDMLLNNISQLREAGLKFSVDDFGTGYASFGQLKTMPVDAVKLDRVFLQGIASDARDASITRGLLRMITDLGLTVIAEGVETTEQFEFLSRHGCQMAQGWLFDHAMPAKDFVERALVPGAWPGAWASANVKALAS